MKIGIFVSGQIRESYEILSRNIEFLKHAFDNAEMIYGVWDYDEKKHKEFLKTLDGQIEIIEDFEIHYRPYLDNPDAVDHYQYRKKFANPNPKRHPHQTKQMLVHNMLLKKYGEKYDVIVRSRWDTTVSPFIDFTIYAKEVYNTPCTMNISVRKDYENRIFDVREFASDFFPYMNHRDDKTQKIRRRKVNGMFLDNGIILHRYDDWNFEAVDRLHNNCKLLNAEFGWWQILVENTKHHRWIHYDGGASTSRGVIKKEKEIIKRIV